MSSYTWNGVSTNWNFGRDVHKLLGTRILFKTSSKVTSKKPQIWTGQHFRPKPLFKSYSRHHQKLLTKKPQIWTGPHFRPKPLLKSFSRHHQKLHPKNPKFELDHILDQNPFLVFWTNIACKWCNLFLRTFGHLHFWEGFQGLELGGTLWVNTKTGKGIRIWVFLMPHEWTSARNIFMQLCWVIYLLGKHSKGRLNLSISEWLSHSLLQLRLLLLARCFTF